ncbi:MAG: hypothetical protein JXM73_03445 [Anaerolineae bacterium]|nr:hypothetical protein [Anaerolineae bacterium]
MRDLMTNRRFAIPLIIMLALCLIGLLLLGVVFVSGRNKPVAEAAPTATLRPTQTLVLSATPSATTQPTAKPTNTLVPVGTLVSAATATLSPAVADTAVPTTGPTAGTGEQPTATPPDEDELADTGVGWGLILASGVGLALLFIAARRLRLAG